MHADEHEPSLGPEVPEEIEHEADIPILEIELGLIEEMNHRIVQAGRLQQEGGPDPAKMPHLV